jgi:membrane associated rhomboid family serine protease
MTPTSELSQGDPNQFGTTPFFASIGRAFVTMCFVVPVLFVIELIDQATHHHLDRDAGIVPRQLSGLDGIVFAPFLHASFLHLYGNSVPLILTGTFALAAGGRRFLGATVFIALVSGLGVWLTADSHTYTIGASGVIMGYLGYLLMRGLVERSWWSLAVALLVGGLYGWQISGVVPNSQGISWQAHLFGFIGGVVAAILFRRRRPTSTTVAEPLGDTTSLTLPPVV